MDVRNSIKLKSMTPDIYEEQEVAEVLYPGHLVEENSSNKVQKHSTVGGTVIPRFALETGFMGKGLDDPFDPNGEIPRASVWAPKRGELVLAVLADGQNVSPGDKLQSAGDGTLKVYNPSSEGIAEYANPIVGEAVESLNLTTSSGATASELGGAGRIAIRVA